MGKTKGKAHYNDDWEDASLYPDIALWIGNVDGKDGFNFFRCKVCKTKKMSLSNMGISAVRMHMKNQIEGKLCKDNQIMGRRSQNTIHQYASTGTVTTDTTHIATTSDVCHSFKTKSNETVIAEIYWVLDTVRNHTSLKSAGKKGPLFKLMFKGNVAAEEFGMSSARLSYVINFGLAPYFKELMSSLVPSGPRLPLKFVSAFDESHNKVTFSKQMDVHIMYYDEKTKRVKRNYIASQFMLWFDSNNDYENRDR